MFDFVSRVTRVGLGLLAAAGVALAASAPPAAHAQAGDDGAVQSCLWVANVRRTRIVDDRSILFYMRSGDIFHNQLRSTCHGLKRTGRFTYDVLQGRLCVETQIAVLTDLGMGNWMPTAVCQIGLFQPIDADAVQEVIDAAEVTNRRRPRRDRGQIEVTPAELPPAESQ